MASILDSEITKGIGQLFRDKQISVPFYQRSYAWKEPQVKDLFDDFRRAVDEGRDYYFLGSIVGCQNQSDTTAVEIVDGQQRLATTAILLAAIRDKLVSLRDTDNAGKFEGDYLFDSEGFQNTAVRPKLRLSEADNDFFQRYVINRQPSGKQKVETRRESHRLIIAAARMAAKRVEEIAGSRSAEEQKGELDRWVKFIRHKARVLFVVVQDEAEAFVVFETLNARGLDLTIADLTKNHLFMKVGKLHIDDAKSNWARMSGTLIANTDSEITKTYIHHLWSSYNGVTRIKELFGEIRAAKGTAKLALDFTKQLADESEVYAALRNSDSSYWNPIGRHAKKHLAILNTSLKVSQVRVLLLAVVEKFSGADIAQILTCCVWWSVRFLIAGGSPGNWESYYAKRAKLIRDGELGTAKELIESMAKDVPTDEQFGPAFATATVSTKTIARYFLHCLEGVRNNQAFPHLGDDDEIKATLEHVMPESGWPGVEEEDRERLCWRLGNLALLPPNDNSDRANGPFRDAKRFYRNSPFKLTQEIAKYAKWSEIEISERQTSLAELAVKAWPVKPIESPKKKKRQ